jgi:hypothetical protein
MRPHDNQAASSLLGGVDNPAGHIPFLEEHLHRSEGKTGAQPIQYFPHLLPVGLMVFHGMRLLEGGNTSICADLR